MKSLLVNAQQGRTAFATAYEYAKPMLIAGHRLMLEVKPAPRSAEANARLHAMLGDVAKQLPWAGKHRSIDQWKRLTVSAWLRAEGKSVEVLPAIDGHGIDVIYEPTSQMSGAQVSSLMDYIDAWGAEAGVRFTAPEYHDHA